MFSVCDGDCVLPNCCVQNEQVLAHQSNEILTAIVQGMRKEEPSDKVRLAATRALLNSLEFTKTNFEKEVSVCRCTEIEGGRGGGG